MAWINQLDPKPVLELALYLKTSLGHKAEGYPSFMLKQAWDRKELNTFLGSWTELKHDTILYTKQVYADEMGGE